MKYKIVNRGNVVADALHRLVNSYSNRPASYKFHDGRTLQDIIDAAKTAKTPEEFDEAIGNGGWTTSLCDLCGIIVSEWVEITTIGNVSVVLCKACINKVHAEFAPITQRTE